MKHIILAAALCAATPAIAQRDEGGNVGVYADRVRSYHGQKRIGWFYSAAGLWLGNPGSCVDSDSMVHLHPVTDPGRGQHVPFPNAWNDIVDPHTPFNAGTSNSYASIMSRTPWGRRVFNVAYSQGCFANPNGCSFYGPQLMAMGVPTCR